MRKKFLRTFKLMSKVSTNCMRFSKHAVSNDAADQRFRFKKLNKTLDLTSNIREFDQNSHDSGIASESDYPVGHLSMNGVNDHTERISHGETSTAGIIVIGEEILRGHTLDTNSNFICKQLHKLGVKVKKISVIEDDVDIISSEVAKFSSLYKFVITTGGVGPTHDDQTHLGVAQAFNELTKYHPTIMEMAQSFFKTDKMTSAQLKLCEVAESARVHVLKHPKANFPLVSVRNVYIFPGVPELLQNAFELAKDLFITNSVKFHTKNVYTSLDELKIAETLAGLSRSFKNRVSVGSYPSFNNNYYRVKVTLESDNYDDLSRAENSLNSALPEDSIVTYEDKQLETSSDRIHNLMTSNETDSDFGLKITEAMSVLEKLFQTYKFNEIVLSFNGGKDCTALLHLFYASLQKLYPETIPRIKTLYIRGPSPFPEVESFIYSSQRRYSLEVVQIEGSIKESLAAFKMSQAHIKAIVMGTRRTDPYSDRLELFSQTDPSWPQFMRVNPLLNWSYNDVWTFLRNLYLPYCSLYDKGYTSLGNMTDTHRNEWLRYTDENGQDRYLPAYKLSLDAVERKGRI